MFHNARADWPRIVPTPLDDDDDDRTRRVEARSTFLTMPFILAEKIKQRGMRSNSVRQGNTTRRSWRRTRWLEMDDCNTKAPSRSLVTSVLRLCCVTRSYRKGEITDTLLAVGWYLPIEFVFEEPTVCFLLCNTANHISEKFTTVSMKENTLYLREYCLWNAYALCRSFAGKTRYPGVSRVITIRNHVQANRRSIGCKFIENILMKDIMHHIIQHVNFCFRKLWTV